VTRSCGTSRLRAIIGAASTEGRPTMAEKQGIFEKIRSALGGATSELATLRAKLEQLRQRREYLQAAALPREDVMAAIVARVDRLGADYPRQLKRYVEASAVTATRYEKLGRLADHVRPLHLVAANGATNSAPTTTLSEAALCYVVGDAIKARLLAALAEADLAWPTEVGPPAAQRAAELQTLERQIAELEAEERELVDQLRRAIDVDTARGPALDQFAGGVPAARVGKAEL
jgi:hypothetical protein